MKLAEELRNDVTGAKILDDWLGDNGVPVLPVVAEARAARCTAGNGGKPCPKNIEPNWWERVKHKAADWIKAEIELKNHMQIVTSQDAALHMCQVCGCCMALKVWTPIQHIKAHVSKEKVNQTPDFCWMRAELNPDNL